MSQSGQPSTAPIVLGTLHKMEEREEDKTICMNGKFVNVKDNSLNDVDSGSKGETGALKTFKHLFTSDSVI